MFYKQMVLDAGCWKDRVKRGNRDDVGVLDKEWPSKVSKTCLFQRGAVAAKKNLSFTSNRFFDVGDATLSTDATNTFLGVISPTNRLAARAKGHTCTLCTAA